MNSCYLGDFAADVPLFISRPPCWYSITRYIHELIFNYNFNLYSYHYKKAQIEPDVGRLLRFIAYMII